MNVIIPELDPQVGIYKDLILDLNVSDTISMDLILNLNVSQIQK